MGSRSQILIEATSMVPRNMLPVNSHQPDQLGLQLCRLGVPVVLAEKRADMQGRGYIRSCIRGHSVEAVTRQRYCAI